MTLRLISRNKIFLGAMRLSYRQHLLEYFIYGIRQRIIFDKKTYIPIGDSYKEEFMKYISQKSIFL